MLSQAFLKYGTLYASTNEEKGRRFFEKQITPFCLVETDKETDWKCLMSDTMLEVKKFKSVKAYNAFKKDNITWAGTKVENQLLRIKTDANFVMPKYRIFDIETLDKDGMFPDPFKYDILPPITLIQFADSHDDVVHIYTYNPLVYKAGAEMHIFKDEKSMVSAYLKNLKKEKPNSMWAWGGNNFDYPYLSKRIDNLGLFELFESVSPYGTGLSTQSVKTRDKDENDKTIYQEFSVIDGIDHMDYIELYTNLSMGGRESMSLAFITEYEKVDAKLDLTVEGFKDIIAIQKAEYFPEYDVEKTNGLYDAWKAGDEEKIKELSYKLFIDYGIKDITSMQALEDKIKYIQVAYIEANMMKTNLPAMLTTVSIWEQAIYSRLLSKKIAVPDSYEGEEDFKSFAGGYVFAKLGFHRWTLSEDVASMYPNIIISCNISPETHIQAKYLTDRILELLAPMRDRLKLSDTPEDYWMNEMSQDDKDEILAYAKKHNYSFAPNGHFFDNSFVGIIPEILAEMYAERKKHKALFKETGNSYHDLMQYTLKIMMNSVYGLLGASFYNLANHNVSHAVTAMGRYMIKTTGDKVIEVLNDLLL